MSHEMLKYIGESERIIDARELFERATELEKAGLVKHLGRCRFRLTPKGLATLKKEEDNE